MVGQDLDRLMRTRGTESEQSAGLRPQQIREQDATCNLWWDYCTQRYVVRELILSKDASEDLCNVFSYLLCGSYCR